MEYVFLKVILCIVEPLGMSKGRLLGCYEVPALSWRLLHLVGAPLMCKYARETTMDNFALLSK